MEEENNIEEVNEEVKVKNKDDKKNIIIILLVIIILLLGTFVVLLLTGVISFKEKETPVKEDNIVKEDTDILKVVVITGDGVRIRNMASTKDSKVLGSASKDAEFELIDKNTGSSGNGCSKDWYKIKYNNREGYVCSEFAIIKDYEEYNNCKLDKTTDFINDNAASIIINKLFSDKTIPNMEETYLNETFCDYDTTKYITSKDSEGYEDYYYKCNNYNSFEELKTEWRKNVTEKFFNNVRGRSSHSTAYIKDYFKESNGSLYMLVNGHGGVGYEYKDLSKNKYNIISHNSNEIVADLVLYVTISTDDGTENYEIYRYLVLKNESGTWKIDEYLNYCDE